VTTRGHLERDARFLFSPWRRPPAFVVTGSGGFVGRVLTRELRGPWQALHLAPGDWRRRIESTRFRDATVIHLAAPAHASSADAELHDHDTHGKTAFLASAAARGGARRMVFLSSVKAIGEETAGTPFTTETAPRPIDAYGRAKLAAEHALAEASREFSMEHVIVRAPLVLGAGARGNLASLMRLCDSPWPLPFAAIDNRRSFVHVADLARLLVQCAQAPQAAARTYLAAHEHPFSTPRMVSSIRAALERPPRLFKCEPASLEAWGRRIGRPALVQRLTRSLEVDASAASRDLGWSARHGLEDSVREMALAYRAMRRP
jgi:UDP-glucose 4-epimerase